MCDALVALSDATKHGSIIFGKNSDRPAGECQVLHFSPGGKYRKESAITCSYLDLPDCKDSLATMGCRPYWCWGYETGMNEAGVVGGNTAVFTRPLREKLYDKYPGLIGMELLRLGLERGDSAEEAMMVIIDLLEKYGQWGSATRGKDHDEGSYDNAFLLVDKKEAWVLETAGRRWVAERIDKGARSISNQLTIRQNWTDGSGDIEEYAIQNNWWNAGKGGFDFALAYSDHENYSRQVSHLRWMRGKQLLDDNKGDIDVTLMMKMLRDHYEDTFLKGPQFHRFLPDFHTICMHNSPSGFTWGDTATSVIIDLNLKNEGLPCFWLCYLPPCVGIYNAYLFGGSLPEIVTTPGKAGLGAWPALSAPEDTFIETSLWWRFYRIMQALLMAPEIRGGEIRSLFDPIELNNVENIERIMSGSHFASTADLNSFVQDEIKEVLEALSQLEKMWNLK